jgi:hypothetical protein
MGDMHLSTTVRAGRSRTQQASDYAWVGLAGARKERASRGRERSARKLL